MTKTDQEPLTPAEEYEAAAEQFVNAVGRDQRAAARARFDQARAAFDADIYAAAEHRAEAAAPSRAVEAVPGLRAAAGEFIAAKDAYEMVAATDVPYPKPDLNDPAVAAEWFAPWRRLRNAEASLRAALSRSQGASEPEGDER